MKRVNFAFVVIIYIVFTHINCDINSSYLQRDPVTLRDKILFDNFFNASIPPLVSLKVNNTDGIIRQFEIDLDDNLLSNEEKGKRCLENVTRCMEKDIDYETTTDKLSQLLFSSLPPFDLSNTKGVSSLCRKNSKKFMQALNKFKLWALKMYDASAKLPAGILNGNMNQLGDFDMCLSTSSEDNHVHGQYCLASIEVQIPSIAYLSALHRLMLSHYHFKSRLEDPGHRVPRFSSIHWGLCVPNSCTANDVELGLKEVVNNIIKETDIEVRLEVDPSMCYSNEKFKIPTSTILATIVFGTLLLFVGMATLYDHYAQEEKNQWLTSFSLKRNVNNLLTIKRSSGDIEAVHGIRFLNAILLLLAHKSMALFFLPYNNRTDCIESIAKPWSVIGRAASLYTDPFILISGTLTTYSLLGTLNRTRKINLKQEYISRLFRILPTFIALIAFCTFILPWLSWGPMWNLVVTQHSDICKKNWWRNMLFIHNYFGFKDMCLTHTHHVGIDTQLFFVSPFLVYLLWKWPRNGTWFLTGLATISTIMRYYVTYTKGLSNYVHYGTSIQQLFDTADHMYILPIHRATVYIMGIFLGYILKNYRSISLSKVQLRVGSAIAVCSYVASFLGPAFMGSIDYIYNPTHAAWYAAFAPILWCFSFSWIIFTSHVGYRGLLGKFFSWPIFSLWTKISYTVYLTQFPIYFFNVGRQKNAENYEFFKVLFNLKEYLCIIAMSTLLTLLVEMPFQNIRNIIFVNKGVTKKIEDNRSKKLS